VSAADPISLLAGEERILSRADCEALAARVQRFATGGGHTRVTIESWWRGFLRWGRNRVSLAGDQRDVSLRVMRYLDESSFTDATTNQTDDASLRAAVRAAEDLWHAQPRRPEPVSPPLPRFTYPAAPLWSDATYELDTAARGALVRAAIEPAEAAGMLSAGYLEVKGAANAVLDSRGRTLYFPSTAGECSLTVRDPSGTASGWAGLSSSDWRTIDASALAARALDKCLASRDPVAIEPGRYTVILEPQAVRDLMFAIFVQGGRMILDRNLNEQWSALPFFARADAPGFSKLGTKVVDERLTIGFDPMDPALGVVPIGWPDDEPLRAVNWIEHGVLTHLHYDRAYAIRQLRDGASYPFPAALRMSGGSTSVEDMIKTTQRGLLVTRFSNITRLDLRSAVMTGVTRDGLWLVEHGRITKAVKNLRFTESLLFVLNSIDQLGAPVPTFSPDAPIVAPPLKVHDFTFTSTVDAI
jgi:predicted Zn-dependent protease